MWLCPQSSQVPLSSRLSQRVQLLSPRQPAGTPTMRSRAWSVGSCRADRTLRSFWLGTRKILRRAEALKEELTQATADQDPDLIQAAQTFLAMVNPRQAAIGRFNVQVGGHVCTVIQGDNLSVTVVQPSSTTAQPRVGGSGAQDLKRRYQQFLSRLEVEWAAERDSDPVGLDRGKVILVWDCGFPAVRLSGLRRTRNPRHFSGRSSIGHDTERHARNLKTREVNNNGSCTTLHLVPGWRNHVDAGGILPPSHSVQCDAVTLA